MSVGLKITVDRSTTGFDRLQDNLKLRRALHATLALKLASDLRRHFKDRDSEGNKKGWVRSHFWGQVGSGTVADANGVTETRAEVNIADARFPQKLYGGTILPKEAKYLSIPQRAEVAGKSPRLFDDLEFIPLRRGDLAGMLVKKGAKNEQPYYFLFKQITQKPDAKALPSRDTLIQSLKKEIEDFCRRNNR